MAGSRLNRLYEFICGGPLTPALSPFEGEREKARRPLLAPPFLTPPIIAPNSYVVFATGLILAAALAIVLFGFDPGQNGFYPRCFFHEATGLQCPGCGALRAGHQLLHGHVLAALHLNALLVLALPVLAGTVLRKFLRRRRSEAHGFVVRTTWVWLVLALSLTFTILRNFPAFAFLSP